MDKEVLNLVVRVYISCLCRHINSFSLKLYLIEGPPFEDFVRDTFRLLQGRFDLIPILCLAFFDMLY